MLLMHVSVYRAISPVLGHQDKVDIFNSIYTSIDHEWLISDKNRLVHSMKWL